MGQGAFDHLLRTINKLINNNAMMSESTLSSRPQGIESFWLPGLGEAQSIAVAM